MTATSASPNQPYDMHKAVRRDPDGDASAGRALRERVPRADHAKLKVGGRDPVAIIAAQNSGRLPDLIPVRIARMNQSPFAFFRGNAALMAHDLATGTPTTDVRVVASGDAHISNFGLYASPERRLLFDLNDFDEVGFAPWEWDVKRLAASVVISARDNGFREDQAAEAAEEAGKAYRRTLRKLMSMTAIDRYFSDVDVDEVDDEFGRTPLTKIIERTAAKARKRTSARMVEKITAVSESGQLHIVEEPPLLVHPKGLPIDDFDAVYTGYLRSLRPDARLLMSQFKVVDIALRVVGVGSVGTRCLIVLLENPSGETMFLQVKEALRSVLETHGRLGQAVFTTYAPAAGDGRESYRVVAGQQTLQAQSDPFLGWVPTVAGHDFYWRQFRDMKGSVDTSQLTLKQFDAYCSACAGLLARAHSQSPGAGIIADYLGKSTDFDKAIAAFGAAYADQNERDYAAFRAAIADGRLPVAVE